MHALGRGQLEPREHVNRTVARRGSKSGDALYVVVIRDGQHLDARLHGLLNDLLGMAERVSLGSLPPIGLGIVVRIHLQCAPIETRPTWGLSRHASGVL